MKSGFKKSFYERKNELKEEAKWRIDLSSMEEYHRYDHMYKKKEYRNQFFFFFFKFAFQVVFLLKWRRLSFYFSSFFIFFFVGCLLYIHFFTSSQAAVIVVRELMISFTVVTTCDKFNSNSFSSSWLSLLSKHLDLQLNLTRHFDLFVAPL